MPTEITNQGVTEVIHGVTVADPYRWLEDRSSPETEAWIEKEQAQYEEYFRVHPPSPRLEQRVRDLLDVELMDSPQQIGNTLFYRRKVKSSEQYVICAKDDRTGVERVLVDPSEEGLFVSVDIYRISDNSECLAYWVKQGGERSAEVRFMDVSTGLPYEAALARGSLRGLVFAADNAGVYFCQEMLAGHSSEHQIRYQSLRSRESRILLSMPKTEHSKLVLSGAGHCLFASFFDQVHGAVEVEYYRAYQAATDVWERIYTRLPQDMRPFQYKTYTFAYDIGTTENGRILEIDPNDGSVLRVVIPVPVGYQMQQFSIGGDSFYIALFKNGQTVLQEWSLEGQYIRDINVPENCSVQIQRPRAQSDTVFIAFSSFRDAPTILRFGPDNRDGNILYQRTSSIDHNRINTRQTSYMSKDGSSIPVFLAAIGDLSPGIERPAVVTAYGGFGAHNTPSFSIFVSVLIELGFVFVTPSIRGGGDLGKAWHTAGKGVRRQTTFDDFNSCLTWLCESGYTSQNKLAIFGGSNAGLLVGAAITQSPDLIRAAICTAPLLDMVRYHKFDRAFAWSDEYGTAENPEEFRALLAYSPYHNIRHGVLYPSVLFVTGDKDTRCNPAHVRKMAALLAESAASGSSVLVDYEVMRGHAPTMPLSVRVEGITKRIAFLCYELGISC